MSLGLTGSLPYYMYMQYDYVIAHIFLAINHAFVCTNVLLQLLTVSLSGD